MKSCTNCGSTQIENDSGTGSSICTTCGTVIEENTIVSEVGFIETAGGGSVLQGQYVPESVGMGIGMGPNGRGAAGAGSSVRLRSLGGGICHGRDSREQTLAHAKKAVQQTAAALRLATHLVDAAHRLFLLALNHNFVQGRRTQSVVAACLYIVCRREKTPRIIYLFILFSSDPKKKKIFFP